MRKTITFTIETADMTSDFLPMIYETACDSLKFLLHDHTNESIIASLYDVDLPSVIKPEIKVEIVDMQWCGALTYPPYSTPLAWPCHDFFGVSCPLAACSAIVECRHEQSTGCFGWVFVDVYGIFGGAYSIFLGVTQPSIRATHQPPSTPHPPHARIPYRN